MGTTSHPSPTQALADGYDVRLALELHAAERTVGTLDSRQQLARFRELLDATVEAISHEGWDTANAAFHEYQVDLAGNELLSSFYRELSVNLMMQVIRGGRLEGGEYLATEHTAIVEAFEAGDGDGGKGRDRSARRLRQADRARGDRALRRRVVARPLSRPLTLSSG